MFDESNFVVKHYVFDDRMFGGDVSSEFYLTTNIQIEHIKITKIIILEGTKQIWNALEDKTKLKFAYDCKPYPTKLIFVNYPRYIYNNANRYPVPFTCELELVCTKTNKLYSYILPVKATYVC